MAEPIKGKDAVIQFYKTDDFYDFVCATDLSIDFAKETKSTKTIGDGNWDRARAAKNSCQITANGLVQMESTPSVDAFDILDKFMNDLEVQFRIVFTDASNGNIRVIEGYALPIGINMGGGAEGFANATLTIKVNGKPDVRNSISLCDTVITEIDFSQEAPGSPVGVFVTMTGTAVTRFDYRIDGGSAIPEYSNSFFIPLAAGTYSIEITPICENGYSGTPRTETVIVV